MLLRTTRDRGVTAKVEETKQRQKLGRAPNGEYLAPRPGDDRDDDVDFAWRMRTRSNYGDPAMFDVGTPGGERWGPTQLPSGPG
jgi:hypothetical protein